VDDFESLVLTGVWREVLERDDDCPRNVAIRQNIEAADFVFLTSCGIKPETDWRP
jgi:hypothetical protein